MRSGLVPGLVALAGLLPSAIAYLHHGESNSTIGGSATGLSSTNSSVSLGPPTEPSYFTDAAYSGLLIAHVALMILAWLFILPIGKAVSVVLPAHLVLQAP